MKTQIDNGLLKIYTIGHSNVELEKFIGLLEFHGVKILADVRSEPYTKYAVWFNKAPLEKAVLREDIRYVFLGGELGGRPEDPSIYSADGEINYEILKNTAFFRKGLDNLIKIASGQRTAIMCAEEDPTNCHRSLLIAPALEARGIEVLHIRHDGNLVSEIELRPQQKLLLF